MKKEQTTYGLSTDKVIKLLNISNDRKCKAVEINQKKTDLLSDRLNDTLPLYYSTKQKTTSQLKRLEHTIAVLSGEPIGKLLHDPKTSISIIRMTKDYGRKLSTNSESETEHHTANTIYYAAIAHALVYHNRKITKYSYQNLQQSFCLLSKEVWILKNLRDLFAKAADYCKVRAK